MKSSEKILAFAAIFISICALVVSVYQTRMLSQEKDASVWPYLRIENSWGGDYFILSVVNNGIGPAIIKDMHYKMDDSTFTRIHHLTDYILINQPDTAYQNTGYGYSNIEPEGTAIRAGERKEILKFEGIDDIGEIISPYLRNIEISIDYCSVYKKCWTNFNNKNIER